LINASIALITRESTPITDEQVFLFPKVTRLQCENWFYYKSYLSQKDINFHTLMQEESAKPQCIGSFGFAPAARPYHHGKTERTISAFKQRRGKRV
jgi:hypothetical protein